MINGATPALYDLESRLGGNERENIIHSTS